VPFYRVEIAWKLSDPMSTICLNLTTRSHLGMRAADWRPMNLSYRDEARTGDHIWWISDVRRFQSDYSRWRYRYDIEEILAEVVDSQVRRFGSVGE
jgi:hypothetical protein